MKNHARVVVIGGGIAGCSTLYHLTREGWSDVVLVERDELTSGSTWHAAAQVTQFGANQTMVALKKHSIDLYRELAADEEFPINYHITGGMRLAYTPQQVDTYRHFIGMAGGMNVEFEYIDATEAGRRHPLMDTRGLLGAGGIRWTETSIRHSSPSHWRARPAPRYIDSTRLSRSPENPAANSSY